MKHHVLKIQKRFYDRLARGTKTFEIRKNDRDFKTEDTIWFIVLNIEWKPMTPEDHRTQYRILSVFKEKGFWLEKWYCILSLKEISWHNNK